MDSHHGGEPAGAGLSVKAVELVVALCLLAGAIVVIWSNYSIGAGWAPDGPEAGYFPMRVGIIVLACSVLVAMQALRGDGKAVFATWQQLRQVGVIVLPLTAYVGLIGMLGIYVASAGFIVGFMVWVGKSGWPRALLTGAGINLLLFWIFEIQFRVPLPKGPLEAALGY
ncbi:tripartite tricarboxylate transporter TctB family protein [Cupriavidus oxalaticus]|uniref:Tripartite tricarboxylate transporter TctB family protein n=1 Tax=Cupriavidus oxalaticus TaxID=96344 RepID=A0A5P3VNH5_9BURK|nr:tripartite tricarboxylate transporter TctB family protein [Cupriavidus oxalaticus]QEZ46922.1 tripartite tricarboxylate transporter TctB family protein [Cupriavidus oxalaticus]